MAQDTSLNGIRNRIITSIFGRRIGLGFGSTYDGEPSFLFGVRGVAEQVEGISSAGSTIVSTAVTNNLSPFGCSLVGATGASATTAYNLAAPIPGVVKRLFNPTTGIAVVLTTGAGAFLCSTASVTSTQGIISLAGKGSGVELLGLTTALWGVLTQVASSASTNVSFG